MCEYVWVCVSITLSHSLILSLIRSYPHSIYSSPLPLPHLPLSPSFFLGGDVHSCVEGPYRSGLKNLSLRHCRLLAWQLRQGAPVGYRERLYSRYVSNFFAVNSGPSGWAGRINSSGRKYHLHFDSRRHHYNAVRRVTQFNFHILKAIDNNNNNNNNTYRQLIKALEDIIGDRKERMRNRLSIFDVDMIWNRRVPQELMTCVEILKWRDATKVATLLRNVQFGFSWCLFVVDEIFLPDSVGKLWNGPPPAQVGSRQSK